MIRGLLAGNANVLAVVPATRILAGELPLNTVMPALSITLVSGTPHNTLAMNEGRRLSADRVQVTAVVKGPQGTPAGLGYPGVRQLMALVLAACPHQRGTINGVDVDSIIPEQEGPDLSDMATSLYLGSRDFVVRWRAAT